MPKITQDNRILHLATPLGKDVLLINAFTAYEKLSGLFSVDVDMLHHHETDTDGPPHDIPMKDILGKDATITVELPDGTKRYFNGIINRFSLFNRDADFTHYRMEVVPKLWLLTRNSQSRIFQGKSVRDIIRTVLDGIEFKDECQGTYNPRNYCVQYRETDFNFISRLMEEEGIFYFFEHTENSHKMIIADTPQSCRDCPGKSTIQFLEKITDTAGGFVSSITRWSHNYELQSGKVAFWDYHFQLPTSKFDANKPTPDNMRIPASAEAEIYDFPGGYAKRYDGEVDRIFEDSRRHAGLATQLLNVQYKTIHGASTCASLTAGHRFTIENHPLQTANGQHVITTIQHSCTQSPDYVAESSAANSYTNTFTCIPYSVPFRPARATFKPVVQGSQTAVVVGPSGEEIFTDKYGRIKVQFHWDRDGRNDADSSCWLRVGTSIAGNKWGTKFIPRIGQEVIVDFLEGDPDQPIIIGAVYNEKTMPHYELPKFKTLTYIKTRTSPDDGKGYNELRFEDKANKEQVFVRSQKRMDVRVRGSLYETCGGSRNEVIGLKQENQPGGNLAVTVAGCYDLHVKEDMFIGIDKKLNEVVKNEVVLDYQSSLATMVKTKAELNANEITIEAKSKISLKVGGNCIIVDTTGITIAGTQVKINSGGFAAGCVSPSVTDPLDAQVSDNGEPGYLDRPRTGGGRGRTTRRVNAQHYVAPPRAGEDARITAMRTLLADSERGRHALEVYDRYGVQPSFRAGEGSTFNGTNNNMNINPTQTPERQALGFVHEMNHAEAHHENTDADIATQSRADFVNTELNEETEGVIRSIEARNELIDAGHNNVSATNYPLQNEYQQAYNQGVADARAADPNISDADAAVAGQQAGRQRVRDGFNNGEVQTSNTNQPYPDYYGSAWDRRHPAGP